MYHSPPPNSKNKTKKWLCSEKYRVITSFYMYMYVSPSISSSFFYTPRGCLSDSSRCRGFESTPQDRGFDSSQVSTLQWVGAVTGVVALAPRRFGLRSRVHLVAWLWSCSSTTQKKKKSISFLEGRIHFGVNNTSSSVKIVVSIIFPPNNKFLPLLQRYHWITANVVTTTPLSTTILKLCTQVVCAILDPVW